MVHLPGIALCEPSPSLTCQRVCKANFFFMSNRANSWIVLTYEESVMNRYLPR